MRTIGSVGLWIVASACGGGGGSHAPDAGHPDAVALDAPLDGAPDAAPDAAQMVRVFGNIDYNGGLEGVTVTNLNTGQSTTTNVTGDFYFDVVQGSRLVMKATATAHPELFPMIRGVIAQDHIRPRVFYLVGPPDVMAAGGLGLTFDPTKAIVEVDFRNAAAGGYGATLTGGAGAPGFGIVYDATGTAVVGTSTVTGGNGSTLLLGDVPAGNVSFSPIVPSGSPAIQPCDAEPLPLVAGAVTWFDFETGSAMCQ